MRKKKTIKCRQDSLPINDGEAKALYAFILDRLYLKQSDCSAAVHCLHPHLASCGHGIGPSLNEKVESISIAYL